MRAVGYVLCMVSVGLVSFLSAQAPPVEKPPVTMLTGCLRSSAADTAIAGPSGRIFTLEVVEPPSQPAATTTPSGGNPPVASKTTYSLAAPESLGLAKHADHEVQLTGTLQMPATAKTDRPAAGAPAGAETPQKSTAGGGHRTFNVTALKMVSAKCP